MSGSDARALSRSLLDLCRMRKLTIATAESCTGGLVAGALTDIPGSSDVIDRGFVTYSNEAKRAMLGVKATTLATFGAVSKETATAMAIGALEKAGVDLAVSDHRHRRPGRRHAGQAGRPRAFRRRRARRPDPASRMPFRRDRPQHGAPALGGGGAAHADGTGARTAAGGEAAPRSRKPVAPARRTHATAQRRQTPAVAEGVTRSAHGDQVSAMRRSVCLPVNHVGALFERGGKTLERGVEHRAHQHRQHPALEFVGEEKPDVAVGFGFGLEGPAVLEIAERPLQILDHDLQVGAVQRHPAGEGFPHQLERYRHVGDHDLGAVRLSACAGVFSSDWHSGTNSG